MHSHQSIRKPGKCQRGAAHPTPTPAAICLEPRVTLDVWLTYESPENCAYRHRQTQQPGGIPMTPEQFRQCGHQAIDWVADYLANPQRYPVLARVQPGELTDALPARGPEQGEPPERLVADFERLILPAVTHWNHPGFMAFFANSGSAPGILGELLASALNGNGMLWKSCPAIVELEQVTLRWLRQWTGLPEDWFGQIFDTASVGSMHALAAAREAADPNSRAAARADRKRT